VFVTLSLLDALPISVHLENMLTLARLGVTIVPAMPAFYYKPQSMDEMIDFFVGKVLDNIDVDHDLYRRWGDEQHDSRTPNHRRRSEEHTSELQSREK